MNNKFITFEGGEGSGKSTQSKMLVSYLQSQNIDTIWTREIGGTSSAEKIRQLILFEKFLPQSELLLIMAARTEHINNLIKPALKEGKWVVCDRFIDSTASYQSIGSNLSIQYIYQLHEIVFDSMLPDITFYLKIEPEVALPRARCRGDVNKFETLDLTFHQQVFENFNKIAELNKPRIITINAKQDIENITDQIKAYISLTL